MNSAQNLQEPNHISAQVCNLPRMSTSASIRPILTLNRERSTVPRGVEKMPLTSQVKQKTASSIETLSRNLQAAHNSRVYNVTALYIVFKTIENNPNITTNQIKHLLQQEYFIAPSVVEGALGSLSATTMFGCVTRFKKPEEPLEKTHFHIRTGDYPEVFQDWLNDVNSEFPELLNFHAPKLVKRVSKSSRTSR